MKACFESERQSEDNWVDWRVNLSVWAGVSTRVEESKMW